MSACTPGSLMQVDVHVPPIAPMVVVVEADDHVYMCRMMWQILMT